MNINTMQFMQIFKGGNPQQLIQQLSNNSQIMSNPMAKNAMEMLQKGDNDGLKQMAENLCKERGTTMEDVKNNLMQQFNIR